MRVTAGLLVACILLAASSSARASDRLVLIVNSANPVKSLSATAVSDMYLKRRTLWPDGSQVRFVDWTAGSRARALFLRQVLGRSARDVELYWIGQKLYSGNIAPIQVGSSRIVVQFVSRFKGAIGYSTEDDVPASDKIKIVPLEARR